VTGVWTWDGGRVADVARDGTTAIFAPAGSDGDVARGLARLHGMAAALPPGNFTVLRILDDALVVLDRATDANVPRLLSEWFNPAVAALERGALASLSLLADGGGTAVAWHATRPAWHVRTLARLAAPPLVPPARDEDDA
jgi:hypothetical protein